LHSLVNTEHFFSGNAEKNFSKNAEKKSLTVKNQFTSLTLPEGAGEK
jgi:hypothetical protein